uniref:Protein Wnt n=1 Tax=Xenopus tropicalis TaxID=8364 RepID=A0A803JEK6_XENTR
MAATQPALSPFLALYGSALIGMMTPSLSGEIRTPPLSSQPPMGNRECRAAANQRRGVGLLFKVKERDRWGIGQWKRRREMRSSAGSAPCLPALTPAWPPSASISCWPLSSCSHRKPISGFKETAFMYAISAASLTHSLAKACSGGRMERCTCDDSQGLESQQAWQWGVCGDNLRHSTRFLQNFLRQKKGGRDARAKMDLHNSNAGIKAVKSGLKTTCKCHGVSGSCAVRTCWKQLSPFHETGALLKAKYENAIKIHGASNEAVGGHESLGHTFGGRHARSTDFLYLEESPNFCRPSRFSPGTAGRTCLRENTCDSLCCGRGYNIQTRMVTFSCHCQVHWCCHVECQKCVQQQETYTCKH